jgi:hypothetical protein
MGETWVTCELSSVFISVVHLNTLCTVGFYYHTSNSFIHRLQVHVSHQLSLVASDGGPLWSLIDTIPLCC